MRNLFSQPKYTIDTSSLLVMMNVGEKYDKEVFRKLWVDFQVLCDAGKVISHIEVCKEIKEGGVKNQIVWTKSYKRIFQKYNLPNEENIIRDIGSRGGNFVSFLQQQKSKSVHADPWLVAQAKVENLILITEEVVNSP
ncbi:DUF4411 family protein, partial [Candidatus Azambacteria bacterium]|nr:DUF4411 family protein [Candidatus Azambacteria bacterium]